MNPHWQVIHIRMPDAALRPLILLEFFLVVISLLVAVTHPFAHYPGALAALAVGYVVKHLMGKLASWDLRRSGNAFTFEVEVDEE